VVRTEFVDALERSGRVTSLTRALRNAVAFQRLSGTPWRDIVREGWRCALAIADVAAGGDGGQHADAP